MTTESLIESIAKIITNGAPHCGHWTEWQPEVEKIIALVKGDAGNSPVLGGEVRSSPARCEISDNNILLKDGACPLCKMQLVPVVSSPVSLAKCKWELSKVFVPNGIWNIDEGMKMERAAKAVLDTAGVKYVD